MQHLTQIELCAGIGGFGLAGRWNGIKTTVQVEIDAFCRDVLKKNFPDATRFNDLKQFTYAAYKSALRKKGIRERSVYVISGGIPCQPFSHAGARNGTSDDRHLWPEMFRICKEVRPRWVVIENVAGLVSMERGIVLESIFADLESESYSVEAYIIPAVAVGAPHKRDRIWIIAHCNRFRKREQINRPQPIPRERNTWEESGSGNRTCWTSGHTTHTYRERQQQPCWTVGEVWGWPEYQNQKSTTDTSFVRLEGVPQRFCQSITARSIIATANTHSQRRRERNNPAKSDFAGFRTGSHDTGWDEQWISVATRLCRMDDGLPGGMDGTGSVPVNAKNKKAAGRAQRLKGLGNSIVPQVASEIFKAMIQYDFPA